MLKNYFNIAVRNLWRNKVFASINIAGLSVGLACCMLIFLYTKDEVSFDRFHEKKDQLYRITARMIDNQGHDVFKAGKTGMVHGPAFKQEIPEIQDFVRVKSGYFVVRKGNEIFNQDALYVDENFFSVFSFPLITGNPKKVLAEINSIVLTDEMANKYFGKTDVIGQRLELQVNEKFEPFIISGVVKRSPQNSSIKFHLLLPFKYAEKLNADIYWHNLFLSTFVVLGPKAD